MPKLWKDLVLAKKIIKKNYFVHAVVILFVVLNVLCLRDLTLIDWDEGAFALQGQWLASIGEQGKPFNFQTPPLYQILTAILFRLFKVSALMLPLLSIIFSCITIYLIFYLTKLSSSQEAGIYGIILFVTTEFFLFFSKSGLSDATFLCFFTASILFFVKGVKLNKTHYFTLAGLFTACALYTKYSGFPLLIVFLVIGLMNRKTVNKKWFVLSILVPILLYIPYFYLFIKLIQLPEISVRHASLLGINHIKFLLYILIFAPVPFILTLLYIVFNIKRIEKTNIYLLITMVIFFSMLGFYYPYFRLAYPLAPLFSIIAAQFIVRTKKYKYYFVTISVIISLILSLKTLSYSSKVPERIGSLVEHYVKKENIKYVYTVAPPNIDFYISGSIVIPEGHQWQKIGEKFPLFLENKKIIYPDNNELLTENKILLVHATAFDTIKRKYISLYNLGDLLTSIEFIDAPVYYKDIYNPQRSIKQVYEIYLFENKKLKSRINDLWNLGFDRGTTVVFHE